MDIVRAKAVETKKRLEAILLIQDEASIFVSFKKLSSLVCPFQGKRLSSLGPMLRYHRWCASRISFQRPYDDTIAWRAPTFKLAHAAMVVWQPGSINIVQNRSSGALFDHLQPLRIRARCTPSEELT